MEWPFSIQCSHGALICNNPGEGLGQSWSLYWLQWLFMGSETCLYGIYSDLFTTQSQHSALHTQLPNRLCMRLLLLALRYTSCETSTNQVSTIKIQRNFHQS